MQLNRHDVAEALAKRPIHEHSMYVFAVRGIPLHKLVTDSMQPVHRTATEAEG
jgi:hypothetical protein